MIIRKERLDDIEQITHVNEAAFQNHPYSRQTEHFIVKALRAANALTISLVAEIDNIVVGHVAFSKAVLPDSSSDWYGLGPVAVLPKFQRRGIGKSLIIEGLGILKGYGAAGCVLVGDPNYYKQLGFSNYPDLRYPGVPNENVLAISFGNEVPLGTAKFHEAFAAVE